MGSSSGETPRRDKEKVGGEDEERAIQGKD